MQTQITTAIVHVYGHASAEPEKVAECFGGTYSHLVHSDSDLAIFVINPSTGIDQSTIDRWQAIDEFQLPRLVVVTHLELGESDFDDAVMLANRVFSQVATPFLVLHDDEGLPVALISLSDLSITDYSQSPAITTLSEAEHQTLVQEFREEYLELEASCGERAFEAGLLFPAVPLWIEKGIGVNVVEAYIARLTL